MRSLTSLPHRDAVAGFEPIRSFHHREFTSEHLMELKGATTVSVVFPARNEAATIGDIVETVRRELIDAVPLVDELLVIDDRSTDRTGPVASTAGASVVGIDEISPISDESHGKGEVLWKSLAVTTGDLIVWCDADLVDFDVRFVTGVLGPLLTDDELWFAKGFYDRSRDGVGGGGRVTELVARPLLSTFFPDLAGFHQPLSGEYGGRREYLERVPFATGYGVEVGLLIELSERFGLDGMAQVDLDVRRHRNRPLAQLGPMATAVSHTILRKADPSLISGDIVTLRTNDGERMTVDLSERPPHRRTPLAVAPGATSA